MSFPFDGLDFGVHSIERGHFNFAQRGLYYFGLAHFEIHLDNNKCGMYNGQDVITGLQDYVTMIAFVILDYANIFVRLNPVNNIIT